MNATMENTLTARKTPPAARTACTAVSAIIAATVSLTARAATSATRRAALPAVLLATLAAALPTAAHHANSAFDREVQIRVSGTVIRWQFINPHVGIWVEAPDDSGVAREWAGEFHSVQDLYRMFGWNKDTFRPGDAVTLIGNPDRRPDHYSMWVEGVIFADGTEVYVDNNP